ncbi:hypothetical protein OIU77_019960 [Salix suchowensis]|uniref:Uncharacterized protein n=1 Tax=Salix suchowensis TaxID=1278906 RepID=A0ABQ9CIU6_9ROSI|nr:hypothetical protein OIU77_019960 [Salix suchowensis]
MATPPDFRRKSVIKDEVSAAGCPILKLCLSFRAGGFVFLKSLFQLGSLCRSRFDLIRVFIEYKGCGKGHH